MAISVPILEYHDLTEKKKKQKNFHAPYVMHVTQFHKQMDWLYQNGYTTLSIDDLLANKISKKSIVLTFDDGHISNYSLAYPILKKYNFTATFFILSGYIGKENFLSKVQITEMRKNGMRFGSHSISHPYLISLKKNQILNEMFESKKVIQQITGTEISHFSVPYGFYDKTIKNYLKKTGYKTLITEDAGYFIFNTKPFYTLPRFTIKANITRNNFINIVKVNKKYLLMNFFKDFILRSIKRILGYKNYLHLKALILGKHPISFSKSAS